jgi:hypothetical protein
MGKTQRDTSNCEKFLRQKSGTCYFNAALNGILVSPHLMQLAFKQLTEFIETDLVKASSELQQFFWETQQYCMRPELYYSMRAEAGHTSTVIRYAFMIILKAYLCNVAQSIDKKADDMKAAAQTVLLKNQSSLDEVKTEGGSTAGIALKFWNSMFTKQNREYIYDMNTYDAWPFDEKHEKGIKNARVIILRNYREIKTNFPSGNFENDVVKLFEHIKQVLLDFKIPIGKFAFGNVMEELLNPTVLKNDKYVNAFIKGWYPPTDLQSLLGLNDSEKVDKLNEIDLNSTESDRNYKKPTKFYSIHWRVFSNKQRIKKNITCQPLK